MRLSPSAARTRRRRGLTLIELIVVLMILIALAGLLAPMLPSMLTRAHMSTCSTNIVENARAIETYQQLYSTEPNNWDALGDGATGLINYLAGSGGPNGANPTWPPGQGNGMANGEVTPITLAVQANGQDEAANLTGVGINSVQAMVLTPATPPGNGQPFDPTFNYYTGLTPAAGAVPVTDGMILAGLDPGASGAGSAQYARCVELNLSLTGRYVLLGIGPRCSMIGKTVQSAPVHFGDQPALNPEYGYERFVAIFQVSDTAPGAAMTQAVLRGVAAIHDNGLGGIDDHLQGWYQLTTGGS